MNSIQLPEKFRTLLKNGPLEAPILTLSESVASILNGSNQPFFPYYTDHGIDHIREVLISEEGLIPSEVWESSKSDLPNGALRDKDIALLIGATLLHDIAMHIHPEGFKELINSNSRFKPLPWFQDNHPRYSSDIPWPELWEDYTYQTRRLGERELAKIIGAKSAQNWKFTTLPENSGEWDDKHRLIIGDFIRKHHARLAHEIAIYGFPGINVGTNNGQFPAIGMDRDHPLHDLADLIGLTARSHGIALRVCTAYIDNQPGYWRTPRPMGCSVLYSMALLRIADYFQIDQRRAPTTLLHLRAPQSPDTLNEWAKQKAISCIDTGSSQRSKKFTISENIQLSTLLQIREQLDNLQQEIDISAAVLDEAYGHQEPPFNLLRSIKVLRVESNAFDECFLDRLPYIPESVSFTTDPNILSLLVEPLYGKYPCIGIRELLQNSVDAVHELKEWRKTSDTHTTSPLPPDPDCDISIEYTQSETGTWKATIRDNGIGMDADTLKNYFLRAGASFRNDQHWSKVFADETGKSRIIRSGRFGIGVFALFLLGKSFRLWTQHTKKTGSGLMITANQESTSIEIQRIEGIPVGTKIEVDLSAEAAESLGLNEKIKNKKEDEKRGNKWIHYINHQDSGVASLDWYCWDKPTIKQSIRTTNQIIPLPQQYSLCISPDEQQTTPPWQRIKQNSIDAAYWSFTAAPTIVCNGIKIASPSAHINGLIENADYKWPLLDLGLAPPAVAIIDKSAKLPLTIQRYSLIDKELPFIKELEREVLLSYIAYALVHGPTSWIDAITFANRYPLAKRCRPFSMYTWSKGRFDTFADGRLRWCATSKGIAPADPWIYSSLNAKQNIVIGTIASAEYSDLPTFAQSTQHTLKKHISESCSALEWHSVLETPRDYDRVLYKTYGTIDQILARLSIEGIPALGKNLNAATIAIASSKDNPLHQNIKQPVTIRSEDREKRYMATWNKVTTPQKKETHHFVTHSSATTQHSFALDILQELEAEWVENPENIKPNSQDMKKSLRFVAILDMGESNTSPQTQIAKIWNECLGNKYIPFSEEERSTLKAESLKHPELGRYITQWEKFGPANKY